MPLLYCAKTVILPGSRGKLMNHFLCWRRLLIVLICGAMAGCQSQSNVTADNLPSGSESNPTSAQQQLVTPRNLDHGSPNIAVLKQWDTWIIKGQKQTVKFTWSDQSILVEAGNVSWRMFSSMVSDMIVKSGGSEFPLRLADAQSVDIVPYETGFRTGIKITLGNWQHDGRPLDLRLVLTLGLEGKDEDLVFDAVADEREAI